MKLLRLIFSLFTFAGLICWLSIANADICIDAGGCRMSSGDCGMDVGSGCVSFEEGSCIQAGGCIRSSGECGVDVGSGCISFHEGACYQAGGTPSNGNCVFSDIDPDDCTAGGGTVDNGCTLYAVPEPTPLVLITIGLLAGLGFSKMRKRRH